MNTIQLSIENPPSTEEEIRKLLEAPNSGLRLAERESYDFREPLYTGVGEVIVFATVILNAAQLAATIYRILAAKKSKNKVHTDKAPTTVYIETEKRLVIKLQQTDRENIQTALEAALSHGK